MKAREQWWKLYSVPPKQKLLDRLKTIDNLHKHQTETKGWRDKKVKENTFDI
jgi:hypothetical protein